MATTEIVGWIGNILFSICAFPDVYKCYKNKVPIGITKLYLFIWFSAGIFAFLYLILKDIETSQLHIPLYVAYASGQLSNILLIIAKFKYGKKQNT